MSQQSNYRCSKCRAAIDWQKTVYGNWIPVNLDGTPHWPICPHAEEFRRRLAIDHRQQTLFAVDVVMLKEEK